MMMEPQHCIRRSGERRTAVRISGSGKAKFSGVMSLQLDATFAGQVFLSVHNPEYLTIARVAVEVNARAIPMIVEVAALNGIAS